MFNGETYSRVIACRGYLTSNQNVLIYSTSNWRDTVLQF